MQSGERLMSATVSGSSLVDRKRVDHDAAYHQCVLQFVIEYDQLSRRHSAVSVFRKEHGRYR